MGLHYAPFELVHALCKVYVDGHPSAVFCAEEEDLVSRTWALVARAFPSLDDYFGVVKFNIEPLYYAYGGSPLDELSKKDHETVRNAYKPVIESICMGFSTAFLSCAALKKAIRIFGGTKEFRHFAKACGNIISLDPSYEKEAATRLGQSLEHLVKRRLLHCGKLTSDHPEVMDNIRMMRLHREQCERFDEFLGIVVRIMTGDSTHVVTVGRDILQQQGSSAERRTNRSSASRTEREILLAIILAGSTTMLGVIEAKRLASRIQAMCSQGRPIRGEHQQTLVAGVKSLAGIDVSTAEGDGHVVEHCVKIILSARMDKASETQQEQGTWDEGKVNRVMDLEKRLHDCRQKFVFISLAIPGKYRKDQMK